MRETTKGKTVVSSGLRVRRPSIPRRKRRVVPVVVHPTGKGVDRMPRIGCNSFLRARRSELCIANSFRPVNLPFNRTRVLSR